MTHPISECLETYLVNTESRQTCSADFELVYRRQLSSDLGLESRATLGPGDVQVLVTYERDEGEIVRTEVRNETCQKAWTQTP